MINVKRSNERGQFDHGWLKTSHSFSFGDYFDRYNMHFRSLRVINEDFVAASSGFPLHPHRDMEIFTYVIAGELTHTDSLGHRQVLRRGDVQYTNAGRGIEHSEYNEHPRDAVHLLQIWIMPPERSTAPSYSHRHFADEQKKNTLTLMASAKNGRDVIRLQQNVDIYSSILEKGQALKHTITDDAAAWIQLISGSLKVGDNILNSGDAATIEELAEIEISALQDSEFLLFNLA